MSPGIALLSGILVVVAIVAGLQVLLARRAQALVGQPVPALDGPLAQRARGDLIVWFHSRTCGPCKAMEPAVRALVDQGLAEIVDVQDRPDVTVAFGVMATPTTVFIRGGRVEQVRTGVVSPRQLMEWAGS